MTLIYKGVEIIGVVECSEESVFDDKTFEPIYTKITIKVKDDDSSIPPAA